MSFVQKLITCEGEVSFKVNLILLWYLCSLQSGEDCWAVMMEARSIRHEGSESKKSSLYILASISSSFNFFTSQLSSMLL